MSGGNERAARIRSGWTWGRSGAVVQVLGEGETAV